MKAARKPFLTRFFKAWADDIRIPVTSPPKTQCICGRKTDSKTIERYISALQNCFILYEAKRYDVKGKLHGDFVYEVRIDGYVS